ncbi:DDE-1 domain-containing protein, partial [Aphis craccivora]
PSFDSYEGEVVERCAARALRTLVRQSITDLAHGYLQIPLTDAAKPLTNFITPDGTGQFTRMVLSTELEGVPPTHIFNFDETNLVDDPGKKRLLQDVGRNILSILEPPPRQGRLSCFAVVLRENCYRCFNSPSGWFDSASFLEWFESIFIPEPRRLEGKRVVICDNVAFHFSAKVLELSETNNITFICLPPNSTHITQPLDVAVFRSIKGSWRKLLGEWKENNGNNLVTKEIMPTLLRRLLLEIDPTITKNLKSGFQACGIFPRDVEVLLKKNPGQTADDSQSIIESSLITCLEKKIGQKKTLWQKKKINVPPGKSITTADLAPEPSTSTATHAEDRREQQEPSTSTTSHSKGRQKQQIHHNKNHIRLCSNGLQVEKLIIKPNFDRRTIFTENLAAIHMKRTEIFFKQPIYIGMCILDLSKSLMYDFYYNTIKKKYGNRVRLLYTDTDSLILEIKTDDFYQDIKINLDHFDTSDYQKDNIYDLHLVNKKVLGKFKDELNGKIMTEFIGLRSKLYSLRILDSEKEIKKSKGVKKNVVENKLCFDDFK